MSLRLEEDLYRRAKDKAMSQGKKISTVLRQLLAEWASDWVEGNTVLYTVEPGDTLWSIAEAFYGRPEKHTVIAKANKLKESALIHPGDRLRIPLVGARVPRVTRAVGVPEPPEEGYQLYTVQPGDTLSSIAKTFLGDPRKYTIIAEQNGIVNPSLIRPGQVLRIYGVEAEPPPAEEEIPSVPPSEPTPTPEPVLTISWVPSPNYNMRPSRRMDMIVVHSTASSKLTGVISWFQNPTAYVSAHYTVDKDGSVVQMVKDEFRAWHAGESQWQGEYDCNDFSLGIELVNLNDGVDPYPPAQYASLVELCRQLRHKHDIPVDRIVGHVDIAVPTGRKSDPRGLDLARLREDCSLA